MPNITKPNDINNVWAATGDIVAPAADYIANGWEAIIPPREYFNWLDNRQDRFNAHVNQHGIPVWDASTEYQAGISYTKGSDGFVYKAVTTNSNVNPVGDTTKAWTIAFNISGSVRITSNTTFTVPLGVTSIAISACGGGAGGGGGGGSTNITGTAAGGGGGGAGQNILKQRYTVTPGQNISIFIGGGGSRGTQGTPTTPGGNGGAGGNTIIGGIVTLQGGSATVGGSPWLGTLVPAGGRSSATGFPSGSHGNDGAGGFNGGVGNGGMGASGPFGGGGGSGRAGSTGVNGYDAFGYGSGGGGGGGGYGTSNGANGGLGGLGAPGVVIIEW